MSAYIMCYAIIDRKIKKFEDVLRSVLFLYKEAGVYAEWF